MKPSLSNLKFVVTVTALVLSSYGFGHSDPQEKSNTMDHEISHNKRDPDLYIKRGRHLLDNHQFSAAAKDFKFALSIDQTKTGARYYLAKSLMMQKEFDDSHAQINHFISSIDTHNFAALSRGYSLVGDIYMLEEKGAEAIRAYERAITLSPSAELNPYIKIADAYSRFAESTHMAKEGLAFIELGLRKLGQLTTLHEHAIALAEKFKLWSIAIDHTDRMIQRQKRLAPLHLQKAELLYKSGNSMMARAEIDKAEHHYNAMKESKKHTSYGRGLEKKIQALYKAVHL